ncbi:IS630 transposase-related protein [Lachnospiraceae bacterium ZAX-1]
MYAELYESFKIDPSALEDWQKLLEETGSLKPDYRKTRSRKIDREKLKQSVKKTGTYLSELAEPFGYTGQAVFYAFEKMNLAYKKSFLY